MERHELDLVSLVSGVVFIALGVMVLSDELWSLEYLRWALPVVLIALGGAILLHAISSRAQDRPAADGADEGDTATEELAPEVPAPDAPAPVAEKEQR